MRKSPSCGRQRELGVAGAVSKIDTNPGPFFKYPLKPYKMSTSTPLCRETVKQVHAELDGALRKAYREIGDLTLATSPGLKAAIRACDKMKLLLDNDFHGLWLMEREDRQTLETAEETRKREACLAACARPLLPSWREQVHSQQHPLDVLRALLARQPAEEQPEESPLQAALKAMRTRTIPVTVQSTVTVTEPVHNPEDSEACDGDCGCGDDDLYS
jgi:hypothetical protein